MRFVLDRIHISSLTHDSSIKPLRIISPLCIRVCLKHSMSQIEHRLLLIQSHPGHEGCSKMMRMLSVVKSGEMRFEELAESQCLSVRQVTRAQTWNSGCSRRIYSVQDTVLPTITQTGTDKQSRRTTLGVHYVTRKRIYHLCNQRDGYCTTTSLAKHMATT